MHAFPMKTCYCKSLLPKALNLKKRGNLKLSDTKGWKFAEKIRAGKWPTLFSEGWKVADTIF